MSTPQGWQDWNFPVLMFESSMWIISHWKKRSTVLSIWSTPIPIILETWRLLGLCWVSGSWMWKKDCNASLKKQVECEIVWNCDPSMVDKWHFLVYDFQARFVRTKRMKKWLNPPTQRQTRQRLVLCPLQSIDNDLRTRCFGNLCRSRIW